MSYRKGDHIHLKSVCYAHTKRINIRHDGAQWDFDPKDNTKCIFDYTIVEVIDDKTYKIESNELICEMYGIHEC